MPLRAAIGGASRKNTANVASRAASTESGDGAAAGKPDRTWRWEEVSLKLHCFGPVGGAGLFDSANNW